MILSRVLSICLFLVAGLAMADPPPPADWNTVGGTKSKLSIHVSWGAWSQRFSQNAQPRVIKILDEVKEENAAFIKRVSPHTIVVGRIYEPLDREVRDGDPKQRAREWWQRQQVKIKAAPSIDYWEGYNEPIIWTADQMRWYAEFEAERVRLLAAAGRKAIIGSFSVGHPDLLLWPYFFPAIDEAMRNKGVLGLHEYGKPMQQDFDAASGEGWRVGRYRKIYKQHLIPTNRKIPLIISETGVDIGGNPNTDGWRQWYTADQYFEQLKWYDSLMQQDSYVVGATIFAVEIPGWASFDITPVMNNLEQHVRYGTVTYGRNGSIVPQALPDVLIEDVWIEPANPLPNQSVKVYARVRNVGNAVTGNVVGVGFRINNEFKTGWWHTEQPMSAGEVKTFRMDVDYLVPAGANGLVVQANVDDVNRFPESNESNNTLTKALAVSTVPVPTAPMTGTLTIDPNQQWRLISLNSNKALDVEAAGQNDGKRVQQWDYGRGNNQRWKIQATTAGFFKLVAVHSSKCLDNSNPATGNGTIVHQWACHGGQNQNWNLRHKGNGVYDLINASGGRCLDIEGALTNNGAKAHMWDCHGRNNQLWRIEQVNANGDATGTLLVPGAAPPAPSFRVSRIPSPMIAGQTQTATYTSANVTSVTYRCSANGTGYKNSGSLAAHRINTTSSGSGTASAAWVGYPSTCIWTATGPGGTVNVTEILTTVAAQTLPPRPPMALISQVNRGYALGVLQNGQSFYTDRGFTLSAVPAAHAGSSMIKTANNDKKATGNWLSFTLGQAAKVYVAFDSRATRLPTWLSAWETTGETIGTTDASFKLYRKSYAAGAVTLGGNADSPMQGAGSNYFVFAKADTTTIPPVTPTPAGAQYAVVSSDSPFVMDIGGVSTADGAGVGLWNYLKAKNQLFRFEVDGSGYRIIAQHSNKCITDVDTTKGYGGRIRQYACNGGVNQRWIARAKGNGKFELESSAQAGYCLDVAGGNKGAGTLIQKWQCTGGAAQIWYIPEMDSNGNGTGKVFGGATTTPPGGGTSPPPSDIIWDPRLTQINVSIEGATNKSQGYWKLVSAKFENDSESGGNHNIYILLKDQYGNPIGNERDWTVSISNGEIYGLKTKAPYNGQIQWGDYPVYGKGNPYDPLKTAGPYSVWVGTPGQRAQSEVVKGMGAFYSDAVGSYFHSNYRLIYQWVP